jgi:hypothetical protein
MNRPEQDSQPQLPGGLTGHAKRELTAVPAPVATVVLGRR